MIGTASELNWYSTVHFTRYKNLFGVVCSIIRRKFGSDLDSVLSLCQTKCMNYASS